MALGKRKREQQEMWVATGDLPKSPGHPFYRKLNGLLAEAGFDAWIERQCEPFYKADGPGRPSIAPGVYFRMILVGYFEGIASQRGIAWRCSDSRSLAEFLGLPPTAATPDHSTLSRTHHRLPESVHADVFRFVLAIAQRKGLVAGQTVAVDSTTLEANAAMKSIVRKDTGADWKEYLTRLAKDAGLEDPTDADLRKFDKTRKDKKVSNDEWESATDPDSRIARMKDGTTHLAYKAEHVVDLDTEFILAAAVYPANRADRATLAESLVEAQKNLMAAQSEANISAVAADKGYHATEQLVRVTHDLEIRTYIPEPRLAGERTWTGKPPEHRSAVCGNRRRAAGEKGKRLGRLRSEYCERTFAHVCETGGGRRCWLHGLVAVAKRYLLQVAARNLGLLMRKLFGVGTARSLQGSAAAVLLLQLAIRALWATLWRIGRPSAPPRRLSTSRAPQPAILAVA